MSKVGRKRANIDWDKIDKLLIAGCIGTEVASHIGMHPNTLYRRCEEEHNISFSAYLQEKRAKGDSLLKIAQFDEAVNKRDRGMLIWLGKNRLGQTDKSEVAHEGKIPIEIVNYSDHPIQAWQNPDIEQQLGDSPQS